VRRRLRRRHFQNPQGDHVLKGLGNIASLIKQAQQMGGKLEQLAVTLRAQRAEGTAGGGLVTVEVNGLGEVLRCAIDPSIAGDREMIEDLLPAAANQALTRAKTLHAEAMKSLTQGVDMSGFGDVLAQLSGGEPPGSNP
jgi:DNA-binding YbaB/EbfC family protein